MSVAVISNESGAFVRLRECVPTEPGLFLAARWETETDILVWVRLSEKPPKMPLSILESDD